MKKVWLVMLFLFVPSIAFASTGGPVSGVIGDVMDIVAYAIVIAIAGLIALVAKWVATKFKVSVPSAWMDSANVWLDKAINYAEEWAKNQLAQNKTINSNDKLNTAIEFLDNVCDEPKLVTMAKEDIQKLIEARLGEHRGNAASNMLATFTQPEVKMIATSDDGSVKLHMTDGSEHEIGDMLEKAGYVKAQTKLPQ